MIRRMDAPLHVKCSLRGGADGALLAKLYKGKLSRNDNDEKNVEGITAKTVRQEGSICELSSDIPPNWKDI